MKHIFKLTYIEWKLDRKAGETVLFSSGDENRKVKKVFAENQLGAARKLRDSLGNVKIEITAIADEGTIDVE